MKTSSKLFIAAIWSLLILLVIYDFGLKADYIKGAYTSGNERTLLNFKDFDRVHVNGAGIKVMIVPGKYRVETYKESAVDLKITQTGRVLTIDMAYPREIEYFKDRKALYLYMPELRELRTDAKYTVQGNPTLIKRVKGSDDAGVVVQGFSDSFALDSLTVVQDNASTVHLTGNNIGFLRTVSGVSEGSRSAMNIQGGNHIQSASFDVRGSSFLILKNVAFPKVQYQFSDSAQVELSGASSLSLLKK